MTQQEILKKIGSIIAELQDQYNYLENGDGELNQLELELFKANTTFLSDHVEILKKITNQYTAKPIVKNLSIEKMSPSEDHASVSDYFKEEDLASLRDEKTFSSEGNANSESGDYQENIETPVTDELPAEKSEHFGTTLFDKEKELIKEASISYAQFDQPEETIDNVFAQNDANDETVLASDSTMSVDHQVLPHESSANKSLVADREFAPQIEAPVQPQISFQPEVRTNEQFSVGKYTDEAETPLQTKSGQEPSLTLNQQIAAQNNKVHPNTKVIDPGNVTPDLQALISLNDKLLFVRELFNGYNLAYAEAINILNRYTSFEQSEQFLKANYASKNSWQDKPAATERFYDLLRKRFGA